MLCKRPTKKIEDTVKEMGGSEFIIEEKLDGERMQLHKRGNEYFYCSRYFARQLRFNEPNNIVYMIERAKITPTSMGNMSVQGV